MSTVVLALPLALHRAGLRQLLTKADYLIIGEVSDLVATPASDTIHADFVVVAATLCPVDMDVLRQLRQTMGNQIVVLGHTDDLCRLTLDQIVAVDGVISFDTTSEGLIQSLSLIRAGEQVIPRALIESLMTQYVPKPIAALRSAFSLHDDLPPLTRREADVLRYLVRGVANKAIARELGISEATIKVYIKGLLRKLRVSNRTQAALLGRAHGYGA